MGMGAYHRIWPKFGPGKEIGMRYLRNNGNQCVFGVKNFEWGDSIDDGEQMYRIS